MQNKVKRGLCQHALLLFSFSLHFPLCTHSTALFIFLLLLLLLSSLFTLHPTLPHLSFTVSGFCSNSDGMRKEKGKTEFAVFTRLMEEIQTTETTKICNTASPDHMETHVDHDYMAIFMGQRAMKLKLV